jgi:hypothetical protein
VVFFVENFCQEFTRAKSFDSSPAGVSMSVSRDSFQYQMVVTMLLKETKPQPPDAAPEGAKNS